MYPVAHRGVPQKERVADRSARVSARLGRFRGSKLFWKSRVAEALDRRQNASGNRSTGFVGRSTILRVFLGVTLLTRHVDGTRLTDEGAEMLAAAEQMETASFDLMRVRRIRRGGRLGRGADRRD